ncbi:hypothetical protein BC332_28585 [Capsicum chinense]|nr:hypothetical protein BC332_28585 [Capsicum chinense]
MVKCKNPEVRDGTRWEISKAQKIFFDGLRRTNRRVVKRPIIEEKRIIIKGLSGYPEVEKKFYDYNLGWTTRGGNSFYPKLVRDFYENYQARLENICREGEKAAGQPLLDKVPIRGVMVDVFEATINRFLHGPNFTPRATSPTFYAQLKHRENQRSWLATLIADGEPKWLINLSEKIFKASLNSKARFWWGIVCTWLMPTDGDNILEDHSNTSRLEEELFSKKTHNPIRNEENQLRLMLDRGVEIPVDPPVTGTISVPNVEVQDSEAAPPISSARVGLVFGIDTNPSVSVPKTEFAFNPMNFRRVAKQSKWYKAQLKIFAKQFVAIVDKRVKVAFEPYKALSGQIDELENHFNA